MPSLVDQNAGVVNAAVASAITFSPRAANHSTVSTIVSTPLPIATTTRSASGWPWYSKRLYLRPYIFANSWCCQTSSPKRIVSGTISMPSSPGFVTTTSAQPAPEIATEIEKIQGVLGVQAKDMDAGTFEIETTQGTDRRADIAAMVVQRGWGLLEMRPVSVSLEDIFLKLTTTEEAE